MGDTLSQLGHLFLQTIPTVIFVFALFLILGRWFFAPLSKVLKKRAEATTGALTSAREQSAAAEAKAREYEVTFQAARQEVYRLRESERKAALGERDATLKKAREQSEALIRDGQVALAAEVSALKLELETASRSVAREISEMVLSAPAGNERGGRS